jgi:RNA polymerase sigma-70 factor (ECF subfamily)
VIPLSPRGEVDPARLVAGLVDGEPWAQSAVFDLYAAVTRRVLQRALGPGADVDDALQETFLQLFRSVHRLSEPGALRSFLLGIAVRIAASELRRRRFRRWLTFSFDGSVPDREAPGADVQGRSEVRRLYAILDELDPTSRLVFVLRHVEGLELAEVADALSMPMSTMKRRLAKASTTVLARVRGDADLAERLVGCDEPGSIQAVAKLGGAKR